MFDWQVATRARCAVNNNSALNMSMKDFPHLLSLGLFSTLREEIKEVLDLKGTGSLQGVVGPAEQTSVKGKLETAVSSSLPGLACPGGKKPLCTTD